MVCELIFLASKIKVVFTIYCKILYVNINVSRVKTDPKVDCISVLEEGDAVAKARLLQFCKLKGQVGATQIQVGSGSWLRKLVSGREAVNRENERGQTEDNFQENVNWSKLGVDRSRDIWTRDGS